jgi:hypothetical protein
MDLVSIPIANLNIPYLRFFLPDVHAEAESQDCTPATLSDAFIVDNYIPTESIT